MTLRLFGAVAAMLLLAGCADLAGGTSGSDHPLKDVIWDMSAGRAIDEAELAERLEAADIAILGEIHDNPLHHKRQAALVAALAPKGLAFEMVPQASEEGIQVFLAQGGARGDIGPAIGWDRLGWPDWALYRPIFEAAEGAYIAGGGVSREHLRLSIATSAGVAFGPGASAYGLMDPLPKADQNAAETEMIEAHCNALPAAAAPAMVEAQRLRDARFAHAARRAAAIGGGQTVLITGNGHARRDRGVPRYLKERDPRLQVLALGQIEVRPDRRSLDAFGPEELPFDFVWFSAPAEREDPCAAFR